ncbi:sulfotransferase, partial [Haematococcus lacustris]
MVRQCVFVPCSHFPLDGWLAGPPPVCVPACTGPSHSACSAAKLPCSHPHYKSKYGDSAEGFLAYVKEQVAALRSCSARFVGQPGGPAGLPMTPRQAERHCALYFEALGSHEEQIFFHADQIIRGMYSIFLEVWLRHFQRSSMLVLKSEEYFRAPAATVDKVFAFLGLTKPSDPGVVASVGDDCEGGSAPQLFCHSSCHVAGSPSAPARPLQPLQHGAG